MGLLDFNDFNAVGRSVRRYILRNSNPLNSINPNVWIDYSDGKTTKIKDKNFVFSYTS